MVVFADELLCKYSWENKQKEEKDNEEEEKKESFTWPLGVEGQGGIYRRY